VEDRLTGAGYETGAVGTAGLAPRCPRCAEPLARRGRSLFGPLQPGSGPPTFVDFYVLWDCPECQPENEV
jgi:hypothetical protein